MLFVVVVCGAHVCVVNVCACVLVCHHLLISFDVRVVAVVCVAGICG